MINRLVQRKDEIFSIISKVVSNRSNYQGSHYSLTQQGKRYIHFLKETPSLICFWLAPAV